MRGILVDMEKPSGGATQDFIPLKEIRDGVVVLKNDTLRGVLLVSAINLALKSTEEQTATMESFQGFLNTLEFSTQIVIQSRKFDILPYLAVLEERLKNIPEELLRIQTRMYIEYVKTITDQANIMQKHFYVVVPYTGAGNQVGGEGGGFKLFGKKKNQTQQESDDESFENKRAQLEQRMNVIKQGLGSMGLRVTELETEQLIEVFYQLYNPGDTGKSFTYLLGEEQS